MIIPPFVVQSHTPATSFLVVSAMLFFYELVIPNKYSSNKNKKLWCIPKFFILFCGASVYSRCRFLNYTCAKYSRTSYSLFCGGGGRSAIRPRVSSSQADFLALGTGSVDFSAEKSYFRGSNPTRKVQQRTFLASANKNGPTKSRTHFCTRGGGGIRTRGTVSHTTVFKTVAFNHSATPPYFALRSDTSWLVKFWHFTIAWLAFQLCCDTMPEYEIYGARLWH